MSKATKRKHVTKEALDDYFVPEGDEEIVKIFAGRGNNLHEVENAHGEHFLVSMPTKFRKNIWVKRGDYVVMVPIKEGNKVQGEIVYILLAKQIKYLKDEKLWPKEYCTTKEEEELANKAEPEQIKVNGHGHYDDDDDSETTTDDELFENPNHRPMCYVDSSEEETSDEEEEEEDDDDDEEEVVEEGRTNEDNEENGEEEESEETQNNVVDKGDENELEEGIARVKLK